MNYYIKAPIHKIFDNDDGSVSGGNRILILAMLTH